MSFSEKTRTGREARNSFCKDIVKDGFAKFNNNLYVRYYSTYSNAIVYKKRFTQKIIGICDISIIFVDDKHNDHRIIIWGKDRN